MVASPEYFFCCDLEQVNMPSFRAYLYISCTGLMKATWFACFRLFLLPWKPVQFVAIWACCLIKISIVYFCVYSVWCRWWYGWCKWMESITICLSLSTIWSHTLRHQFKDESGEREKKRWVNVAWLCSIRGTNKVASWGDWLEKKDFMLPRKTCQSIPSWIVCIIFLLCILT